MESGREAAAKMYNAMIDGVKSYYGEEMGQPSAVRTEDDKPSYGKGSAGLHLTMTRERRDRLNVEARAHGLHCGPFLLVLFEDWLIERRPLRLVRPRK